MLRTNIKKYLSLFLVALMCISLLAGCAKEKNSTEATDSTANKGPLYTAKAIVDEESIIDTLNDIVTVAILENTADLYPVIDGVYNCESHSIIADTYSEGVDSFDVLALRAYNYMYEPTTGEMEYIYESNPLVMISFTLTDGAYTVSEYNEYSTRDLSAAAEACAEKFPEVVIDDTLISEADENLTPRRFARDGKLYLMDFERYMKYADTLVAEILKSDTPLPTYESYISKNSAAYDKLLEITNVENYIISEFLKGNNDTAKGYVMYKVLINVLEKNDEGIESQLTDQAKAQQYFNYILEMGREIASRDGYFMTSQIYPVRCKIVRMYHETLTDKELLEEPLVYKNIETIVVKQDEKRVSFTKDDAEFAELYREVSRYFTSESMFKSNETSSDIAKSIKSYASKKLINNSASIELIDADGNLAVAYDASATYMFVPKESSANVYNVYKLGGNNTEFAKNIGKYFE